MKTNTAKILVVSMLILTCSVILVAAQPNGARGPYVDEFIYRIIVADDPYVAALLQHEADVGGIPRVTDFPAIWDAGYQTPNEPRIGIIMTFLNNRLYPFDRLELRQAVNRLVDKERIIEELYTRYYDGVPIATHGTCDWWLPPGQAGWINYDCPAPSYDPTGADQLLADAGYADTDNDGILNEPGGGANLPDFAYLTTTPEESQVVFEMSQMITQSCNDHGIPMVMDTTTFNDMVLTLIFPPLDDWQMMGGLGIVWTLHETPYDFYESTMEPLWNCWGIRDTVLATDDDEIMDWVLAGHHTPAVDESRLDWWCHEMKLTLSDSWLTYTIIKVQDIVYAYEPYLPTLLWLTYTAHTGSYDTEPGAIGIVNAAGYGATANYNPWGAYFERRETAAGDVRNPRIWLSGQTLDNLNPTMADSAYEWNVLARVCGSDIRLSPYYQEYMYFLTDGKPDTVAEEFQVGFEKQHGAHTTEANVGWTSPDNVFVSDDAYASSGTAGNNVDYSFDFPTMQWPQWHVTNVEVGIEAYGSGSVDLQAYNGTDWTSAESYSLPTSDPDAYSYVDVTGTVTWDDMSGLRVKMTKQGTGTGYVDYLKVRVKIAPDGFDFGDTADGMYVEYTLRPNMNWTDGHNGNPSITSADVRFTYDLLRFQDNIRYRGSWEKVYKIDVVDGLTVKIYYVDKFVYHFEEIGLFLYAPKHIWEAYIAPVNETLYEPFQDENHAFWIDWGHHHSEWRGWENIRSEMADYPGEYWTDLVGAGSFVYPHGGWEPGVSYRILANRDFVGSRICRADVDINGICDMRDVFQVLYRQGATPKSIRWEHELYSMQGPAADIAPPAQWIGGEEIYVLKTHFGHKWVINDIPVLPPPCD